MKALLTGTTSSAITAGTTQYEPFMTQASTNSWSSSLTAATQTPVPHALTLDFLRVKVATAPGSGKNLVIVVLKNGTATALTCTISGTNTTAQDLTHTVSYSAGDTITLQATLDTGGTAFGTIYWSARQDASGAFALIGAVTSASAGFYPAMGSIGSAGTSGDTGLIVPCAGTVQSFYVNASASAGNFAVYKNAVAQTLTTGSMGAATGNDTTHSFSVVAGDRILVRNTGTARVSSWGMSFLPTTDGQSFVGAVSNGNVSTSSTTYLPTVNVSGSPSTTESWGMLQACTLVGLFAQTSVSPGVSPKAYTFTARQNSTNTAATFAINDASSAPNDGTSGRANNIAGQSITINDDDLISTSIVPASTPIGLHVYVSILISISSGGTGWTASPSDSVTTSDATTKTVTKNLTDSVTTSDANAKTVATNRADSTTTSDSISNKPTKNLSDSVTTSDNSTATTGKGVSLSDSTTTSDSVSKAVGAARSDSVTITDANAKSYTKNLSDTTTVSEAHSSKPTKILADSVTTSDAVTKAVGKTIAETLSATDGFSRTVTYIRTIADSVTVTDGKVATNTIPLADSVTITDGITKSVGKNLTDSVTTSDARVAAVGKTITDSVTTSDVCSPVKPSNVTPTDSVTVTDAITKKPTKVATDSVTTADSIAKIITKALADSVTASDSLLAVRVKALADSVTATDAIAKTIGKGLSDSVVVSEASIRAVTHPRTDSVTISDAISKAVHKNLTDSVTISDHFVPLRTFRDFVFIDDRIRVYKNGQPIVVPTNDWVLHPVIGTRHAVPQVGIGTNAPTTGARYGAPFAGNGSNAPELGKGRISAAPTVGL